MIRVQLARFSSAGLRLSGAVQTLRLSIENLVAEVVSMLLKSLVLALMCSLACAVTQAAASLPEPVPQAGLPQAVAAALKPFADLCRESGGKPITTDAVKRADLNADGHEDFVLDVGSINCDGAASVYGDREKRVEVFVGDGKGGATSAFSDSTFGVKMEGAGAAAKLWLTVSGQACGKKPARDFASENFCERALVWNAKTKKFDYAPVSTVRMIE